LPACRRRRCALRPTPRRAHPSPRRSIVVEPFGKPGQVLLGVLDGHGTFGHLVSTFLSRHLPVTLHQRLSGGGGDGDDEPLPDVARAKPAGPLAVRPAERAAWAPFGAAFADADRLLCGSGVDVLESGSTAVVCHLDLGAGRLTTAWCGDSRAVLAARRGGRWRVVALSDDHKPERPDEKVRAGGGLAGGLRLGARGSAGPCAQEVLPKAPPQATPRSPRPPRPQVRILLNGGRVEQITDSLGRTGGPHRGAPAARGYARAAGAGGQDPPPASHPMLFATALPRSPARRARTQHQTPPPSRPPRPAWQCGSATSTTLASP
jgi:hypothetical protein